MIQLSIIIVNYNVKHFLEQCLISVEKACEGLQTEVFVVDNNSVDGSQRMLREKFPHHHLIFNQKNTGFSQANNQAIRLAKGKYVLLLNPDTIVEETSFQKVVQFMDAHPDAGALGVKMIDGKGQFLPESKRGLPTPWVSFYKIFGLSKLFPNSKTFGKYHLTYLNPDQNHEVEILSGAFMLLRKEVLEKIGMLDEDFFMYGEDIDLSYRVLKAGYKNYYFADTKIIHYKGESTKKGSLNYVRVFYNAMIIFARKHFSGGKATLFILLIRLAVYLRALAAIGSRVIKTTAFPLVEALMVFGTIIGIKEYWEYIHKIPKDDLPYPREFDYIAAPIYTLVLIGFLAIAGGYRKPYRLRSIQIAAFSGFITIATVSFIFPTINYSRMIVGLSATFMFVICMVNRNILNFIKTRNFFFTEETKMRIAVVGDASESARISRLIRGELNYPVEILGVVGIDEKQSGPDVLGHLGQLDEIVDIYRIEEIVFANKSLGTERIISIISNLNRGWLHYKIVPPDVNYLVGPQVIHESLHDRPLFSDLDRKEVKFKKRLLDVGVSGALLLLFPLTFWVYAKPGRAFSNLWRVLFGKFHLVGYIQDGRPGLPKLKHGILNMLHRARNTGTSEDHFGGLDQHYARYYSFELDMEILFKGLRDFGKAA